MNQKMYIVRHCKAEGQSPDASLTEEGFLQAIRLSEFLKEKKIDRIISSPFLRAQQTAQPLSEEKKLPIELDSRLSERVLTIENALDWMEKLETTFLDFDRAFKGGESSREAQKRIVDVVNELIRSSSKEIVLVTHGNLMALLLNYYDQQFGFEKWKGLTNPDVYCLQVSKNNSTLERIWGDK
ncbi:histidine phosphatase family protein [Salirhabdus sp. Marseille-P4669]|uniref:histidine phosphatase family protein n=1 Tax=Salirhabdus sp. Marseille-P4669 TaxID=2042310 RepID=UPI000C79AA12|nr:histidine phosphatase family protein [Salirhabdus sp. Marseille-P4669]